jgi:dipeptidyl aminopeptidase/acylaminoacyl peptidase
VPVEYVVFDDEGHGFTKKKNQIVAFAAILEFLNKNMPAPATPPAATN